MTARDLRDAPQGAVNLFGLERDDLETFVRDRSFPAFHARQIYRWMYGRRRYRPEEWTDLPRSLRREIGRAASVDRGRITGRAKASDGTVKYRLATHGGGTVEAVYMQDAPRVTLCLSTQVGCALGCTFCLTGAMGLVRNLTAGEIVGQAALVREDRILGDDRFNVVFMGMGEPLHNYDATLAAFRILTDPEGGGLSRRRLTVSTAGIAPAIERLAREPRRPRLAVSLNATTDEVRDRVMPVNRRYPLARLFQACRAYTSATRDRLTFEYVLLEGVNDSDADAARLARIVRSHNAKLNLIPFNPVPDLLPFRSPPRQRVLAIRDRLLEAGVPVSVRWSRGLEVRAACGQLALLPGEEEPAEETEET